MIDTDVINFAHYFVFSSFKHQKGIKHEHN